MSRNSILFWLFFLNCIFQVFGQISNDLPPGWGLNIANTPDYIVGVDYTTFYEKAPSGYIKSPKIPVEGIGLGAMVQQFIPRDYLGKQIQLSCFIKYNNINGWTGVVTKVSSVNGGADDMTNRRFNGTSEWKYIASIVDVPEDTIIFLFGFHLSGDGEVWLDNCSFEVVDPPTEPVAFPTPGSDPFSYQSDLLTYPRSLSF